MPSIQLGQVVEVDGLSYLILGKTKTEYDVGSKVLIECEDLTIDPASSRVEIKGIEIVGQGNGQRVDSLVSLLPDREGEKAGKGKWRTLKDGRRIFVGGKRGTIGGPSAKRLQHPMPGQRLKVYHAATKGEIAGIPSVDIGNDYDIMGKGFYFGTHGYADRYGTPQEFEVEGKFATSDQWTTALAAHAEERTDVQRQKAREALRHDGFVGIITPQVGIVWNKKAIRLPEGEKAQHSRSRCLRCKRSPVVDVQWADGRARTWFCMKCFEEWVKGSDREIVRSWYLPDREAPKRIGDGRSVQILKLGERLDAKGIVGRLHRLAGEVDEKSRHSHSRCMRCKAPPVIDIHWANSHARAWFCQKCFRPWIKEIKAGEFRDPGIIRAWHLQDGEAPKKFGGKGTTQLRKLGSNIPAGAIADRLDEIIATTWIRGSKGYEGVIVALVPHLPITTRLVQSIKGALPVEDLHVTLAHLGKKGKLQANRQTIEDILTEIVTVTPPIRYKVGGHGRFLGVGDNSEDAVYASVDSPQLPDLHTKLTQALEAAGIDISSDHGFTPHITLAYTSDKEWVPDLKSMYGVADRLVLCWGDEQKGFNLRGSVGYVRKRQDKKVLTLEGTKKGRWITLHGKPIFIAKRRGIPGGASTEEVKALVKWLEDKGMVLSTMLEGSKTKGRWRTLKNGRRVYVTGSHTGGTSWRELSGMGLTKQDQFFQDWSADRLLGTARELQGMSPEKDDMGFSEQDIWARVIYRQADLRLPYLPDEEAYQRGKPEDAEQAAGWAEWDMLSQVRSLAQTARKRN